MYTLTFSRSAVKALQGMPRNTAALIRAKLDILANDPQALKNNIKKLTGRSGYRLRVGEWRIIYTLQNDMLEIHVIDIGSRGDIYQ